LFELLVSEVEAFDRVTGVAEQPVDQVRPDEPPYPEEQYPHSTPPVTRSSHKPLRRPPIRDIAKRRQRDPSCTMPDCAGACRSVGYRRLNGKTGKT
jgi:hypothetical protein